jgi:hypothetical protein
MQAWQSLSSLHLYDVIIAEGCHIPQQIFLPAMMVEKAGNPKKRAV